MLPHTWTNVVLTHTWIYIAMPSDGEMTKLNLARSSVLAIGIGAICFCFPEWEICELLLWRKSTQNGPKCLLIHLLGASQSHDTSMLHTRPFKNTIWITWRYQVYPSSLISRLMRNPVFDGPTAALKSVWIILCFSPHFDLPPSPQKSLSPSFSHHPRQGHHPPTLTITCLTLTQSSLAPHNWSFACPPAISPTPGSWPQPLPPLLYDMRHG